MAALRCALPTSKSQADAPDSACPKETHDSDMSQVESSSSKNYVML
jgi:hypothetical protein